MKGHPHYRDATNTALVVSILHTEARVGPVSRRAARPVLGLLQGLAVVVGLFSSVVQAGECEQHFSKAGSPFSGTTYSSYVTIADLLPADAQGQMRGILINEKMDVITEDLEGGTLLVEQRATAAARAIPTIVTVAAVDSATRVDLTVKMDKGVLSRQEAIKSYLCSLLAKVQGGPAGRLAGAQGAQSENAAFAAKKEAFLFSMEIANEAKANALALNARHKGRTYTLSGTIDYIQEDGDDYNVSFEIPDIRDRALSPLPGQANFRVGVACLFRQNQLATVLLLREKQRVTFTGTFYRYDDFKKMVWLEHCKQDK